MNKVLYVGMDVHKESIVAATAEGASGEVDMFGTWSNNTAVVDKMLRKLSSQGRDLRFVYEAGPCGYWLARYIRSKGFPCMVAAPSLIPKKSGDRIKTDSRDARNLARLHRSGDLTEVHVPSEINESMRDMVRCREDAVDDAKRVKQRLKAFLLRHGYVYPMKTRWSGAYAQWVRDLNMGDGYLETTKIEYLETAIERQRRVEQIEEAIQTHAAQWESAHLVEIYRGFKGVSDRIAVMLAAELGDMKRFRKPRDLWAYMGLTPSEHSSGKKVQRG
uniref:IS110 family transposase n=1 Tax=Desulfatibacillum aliphaticivorans TaxID=218208 RepID=UPI0004877948